MNPTKHTPGPWKMTDETYFHASRKGGTTINTMPLIPIANVEDEFTSEVALVWKSKAYAQRDEANARLIAAAPDLLSALKSLLDAFTTNDPGAADGEYAEVARAAIARAENP